jgi:hypothetical protein
MVIPWGSKYKLVVFNVIFWKMNVPVHMKAWLVKMKSSLALESTKVPSAIKMLTLRSPLKIYAKSFGILDAEIANFNCRDYS